MFLAISRKDIKGIDISCLSRPMRQLIRRKDLKRYFIEKPFYGFRGVIPSYLSMRILRS